MSANSMSFKRMGSMQAGFNSLKKDNGGGSMMRSMRVASICEEYVSIQPCRPHTAP